MRRWHTLEVLRLKDPDDLDTSVATTLNSKQVITRLDTHRTNKDIHAPGVEQGEDESSKELEQNSY